MRSLKWTTAVVALGLAPLVAQARPVTLAECWGLVQTRSPAMAGAAAGVRSATAAQRQSRVLPNPELELAAEDFGRGAIEVGLSLPLDFGGRRLARVRTARAAVAAARLEEDVVRLRLRAETLRRFGAALALKHKLAVTDTLLGLVRHSSAGVERRVDAGAAPDVDLLRARMEVQGLELESRGVALQYGAACRTLAALWADSSGEAWEPAGGFLAAPAGEPSPPSDDNPAAQLERATVEAARAELASARAEGWPSLGVTGNYARDDGPGAVTLGATASLPLFDRNQGGVGVARHELARAELASVEGRAERAAAVERLRAEMATVGEAVAVGRTVMVPTQQRVLEALTRQYEQGAAGILDVIQAQRELHESAMELTEHEAGLAALAADLLELSGHEPVVFKE
ncbi:MAG: TolC family protein [bacterium]